MPEIHEVRETREVPVTREVIVRRSRGGALFLMFILGLVCAGAIAWGVASAIGVQTAMHPLRITWPAGQVQISRLTTPHVTFQRGQIPSPHGQS